MEKFKNFGYDLSDVVIIPDPLPSLNGVLESNPYTTICNKVSLPIFAKLRNGSYSGNNNICSIFNKANITPIVSDVEIKLSLEERLNIAEETFVTLNAHELEDFAYYEDTGFDKKYINITFKNSNATKVLDLCRRIKETYGKRVEIMVGNVSNPKIYTLLCESCIDWARIGNNTLTCGVHYPTATMIEEFVDEVEKFTKFDRTCECPYTKLIYNCYSGHVDEAIKALAVGVDAVICSEIHADNFIFSDYFNKCLMDAMVLTNSKDLAEFTEASMMVMKNGNSFKLVD